MGIFVKHKASQGCVLVVGVAVDALSQAILAKVKADGLALYQVTHAAEVSTPQIKQEPAFTRLSVNLLDAAAVKQIFKVIEKAGHQVKLVVFQPQAPTIISIADLNAKQMQDRWQLTGLSAISIAQTAIKHMLPYKQGSVIFLGSVHASVPATGWLVDGALQAGLRALAQSLAREFQPQGIHIAYVVLNQWSTENTEVAQAVADTCWHVYQQHDSAWSQELTAY